MDRKLLEVFMNFGVGVRLYQGPGRTDLEMHVDKMTFDRLCSMAFWDTPANPLVTELIKNEEIEICGFKVKKL